MKKFKKLVTGAFVLAMIVLNNQMEMKLAAKGTAPLYLDESPSPTPSGEVYSSESPSPTSSGEVYSSESPSPTPSGEVYPSESPTPTPSGEVYPSESPTPTPSGEVYPSESPTPTPSGEVYPSESPSPTPSEPVEQKPGRRISNEEFFNYKAISAEAGDPTTLYDKGTIADLHIKELYSGSMNQGATIRLKLKNSNYKFTGTFTSTYDNGEICSVPAMQLEDGGKTLVITIPSGQIGSEQVILKNIELEAISNITEGEKIKIDILSEDLDREKYDVTVANISTPALIVKMDSVKDIGIGDQETVQFTISENSGNYLQSGSKINLKLAHGHWDYKGLVQRAALMDQLSGFESRKALEYSDQEYFNFARQINPYWLAKELLDDTCDLMVSNGEPDNESKEDYCQMQFAACNEGDIEGSELILTLGKKTNHEALQAGYVKDQVKIRAKVYAPASANNQKEMILISSYKGKKNETKVANLNSYFTISVQNGEVSIKQNNKQKVPGEINILIVPEQNVNMRSAMIQSRMKLADGWKLTQHIISSKGTKRKPVLSYTLNPISEKLLNTTLTYKLDQDFIDGMDIIIYGKGIDAYCSSWDINKISRSHQIILSQDSKK